MKNLLVVCCFVVIFMGCNLKFDDLKDIVYWNNRVLKFDKELSFKICGRDTLIKDDFINTYKMLVCVGPTGCSDCQLHLYGWKRMIDSLYDIKDKLEFIFVIYVDDYLKFELL